ncbi:unnamed protein product [Victoria cruziana]
MLTYSNALSNLSISLR